MAVGTSKRRANKTAKAGLTATETREAYQFLREDIITEIRIQPGGLEHYLEMVGREDGGNPRFKCYDGSILLVSPSNRHELAGEHIAYLVALVTTAFRSPCRPMASSTLVKPGEDQGIEPDKGFYIQNFAAVQKTFEIKLDRDPPPDLIVEIGWSNPAKKSLAIARDMGIPEVWVYDITKEQLTFFVMKRSGKKPPEYCPASASLALPFLTPENVLPWLVDQEVDLGTFFRKVQKWIRAELAPRVRGPKKTKD